MRDPDARLSTPTGSFARTVFVAGVCLTGGTGIGLFAVPGRSAFFGAGYIGAAISLSLAACKRAWQRARIVELTRFVVSDKLQKRVPEQPLRPERVRVLNKSTEARSGGPPY